MPASCWRNFVKQTLQGYYSKLKPHDSHHEIQKQEHNQHYVNQQQISPNTHLENLHSKYQLE